jgi:ParB family transcriptional regulator, chromosome partitioning protein
LERRLGRGLGSLLGGSPAEETPQDSTSSGNAAREIPLIEIQPNPHQPRVTFAADGLQELRDSISQHGVLQPVVLRKSGDGYELIAGERRCRASKLAGLTTVPAVVREDVTDHVMLELALVENVQRRDLNAIEKAQGYKNMMVELQLTQEQVAAKVGLKRATVANHLRLLDLPKPVQEAVGEGLLSMGHARAILAADGESEQRRLLEVVVREGLSVRAVEALVQGQKQHAEKIEIPRPDAKEESSSASMGAESTTEEPWVTDLQRKMQISLGTKVLLQNRDGYKGKIVLEYYSREDLERLIEVLAPKDEL